jgi:predicted ATPase/signal transduction histidine kinase/tRNA A-37 threonylcarbamoyl transferase component Bud32
MTSILNLSGYRVSEQIHHGKRSSIYRGIAEADGLPVIIKIPSSPLPSAQQLIQLRHQYAVTKDLTLASIQKPLALVTHQNAYALITEDRGGISLKEFLEREGAFAATPQKLKLFLQIAIQLADMLAGLYCHQIVHKDIKPANILFNSETEQIYSIDFSVASLLPKETATLENYTALEGTLAYIAPEQTGRMNRGIDYRCDFYALGITFYELLTGELPFTCKNARELVHAHLARIAVPANSVCAEIPEILSAIVEKLMSKNAEDRYQNALGLKYDLELCWLRLETNGTIAPFALGTKDLSDRFAIPDRIYGRDRETADLLAAFARTSQGRAELIAISGCSGIGKTAIVREIYPHIARQHSFFGTGKFDQFNRNIPFSAVAQACGELVRQLCSESTAEFQLWSERILTVVGETGQLLIDIIPELERVIGQQKPVPKLSGNAARQRFNLVFQKFIRLFATAERPLVIFLDDLQWADLASIELLKTLMHDVSHLLLLVAYRDNEVSPIHPFAVAIDEIQTAGAIVTNIDVKPLDFSALNHLIADTLHCDLSNSEPLTRLVEQKTQGNPFFTAQFLQTLHQGGQITFNSTSGAWQCDLAQVKTLALTDDIVEFMTQQLQNLPASTQELMKLAACVGGSFDIETIAAISLDCVADFGAAMWKALAAGLVIPTTDTYKFFTPLMGESIAGDPHRSVNATYRFLHDRVQQAAYALIPATKKPETHLKIGRLLQENFPDRVFDIVDHLDRARTLITQPSELIALAELNLDAGKKAINATAYAAARDYLQIGLKILPSDAWETDYRLTLTLYLAAAEVAYLNGNLAEMEELCGVVMRSARDILDRVEIYRIQVAALTANGKMLEAIDIGIDALAQLGIDIPKQPDENQTGLVLQTVEQQLNGKEIGELLYLPATTDLKLQKSMQLMADLGAPIFVATPQLYPILSGKMVLLSMEFGNSPASAIGYINYGLVLSASDKNTNAGYSFGQLALDLADLLNESTIEGRIAFLFANWIEHRKRLSRQTISTLKSAYSYIREAGDLLVMGYSMSSYFDANLLSGVDLGDWEAEISTYIQELERVKQYSAKAYLKIKQQVAKNLLITVPQPWCLNGEAYDETVTLSQHQQNEDLLALAYLYTYKLMLAFIFGNYAAALENIAPAARYLPALWGMIPIPVFHFYAALTFLADVADLPAAERIATLDRVNIHQETIELWAKDAPMNHRHKWYLIEAEKQRVLGNKDEAIEYYDLAIAGAKQHQFNHEEAIANELAARFYLNEGRVQLARTYILEAYYGYTRWGASAKLTQLTNLYPGLLDMVADSVAVDPTTGDLPTDFTLVAANSEVLDLATLLDASTLISREVELDRLLMKFLQIMAINAGADKCVLLLKQEDGLQEVAIVQGGSAPMLLEPTPVEFSGNVPISIINQVDRSLQPIANGDRHSPEDAYLAHYQPKSLLCLPMLDRGRSIGILYLENYHAARTFTPDRVKPLEILVAQAAISIENAKLYQSLKASVDLLEQKVEERTIELKAAKELAETSEQAKTTLFNHINHELRTPMNAILGMSEGLLDGAYGEINPKQRRSVEVIANSGNHQLALIDDILDYAKIEAGKLELYREPTNIFNLCDESLSFVRFQATRKKLQLNLRVAAEITDLVIDERRIRQVLINLLSNAVKFTPAGSVSLEATKLAATDRQPAGIRFCVIDTGIGISPENLDLLFQPFVQIESQEGRKSKGTGLGLNLVKEIINLHGGRIRVTSQEGVGSQFMVDLPSRDLSLN